MTDKKNPVGRPSITLDSLPEGWKEKMLDLGTKGASDAKLRKEALGGICHETWARLISDYPEFSESVKRAQLNSMVYWEDLGVAGMVAEKFNPAIYIFSMKNRFSRFYKDKHEVTGEDGDAIKVEHSISDKTLAAIANKVKTVDGEY